MAALHEKLPVSRSSVEPTGKSPSTPTSASMGPSVCTHGIPVQTPSTPASLWITLRPGPGQFWDFWVKKCENLRFWYRALATTLARSDPPPDY